MKAFKIIVLAIIGVLLLTGCNRNEVNAVELDTKDVWLEPILNTTQEENEETTPVFSKNEQIEYERYLTLVDKDTLDPSVPLIEETAIKYVLQLACVTDKERLMAEQEKLQAQGYGTNISKRFNNGVAYYRLRLNGEYSQPKAKELGKEIVQKFLNIKDYLILRVN